MTNVERYARGKIYQLIDYSTGNFYIGSTCLPLHKRLHIHKRASKSERDKGIKIYQTFTYDMFNSGQINIILIEEVDVENKQQLLREENKHIMLHFNNPLCLNTYRSYVSVEQKKKELQAYMNEYKEYFNLKAKEYKQKNKEKIQLMNKIKYEQNKEAISLQCKKKYENNSEQMKQQHKQYWKEHAKEINDKRKEKITCECGQVLSKWNISKHNKTKKHLAYVNDTNVIK